MPTPPLPNTAAHPRVEDLVAFVQGRLDPDAQAAMESHIQGCAECCARLETAPNDTLIECLQDNGTEGGFPTGSPNRNAAMAAVPPALRDHPRYRVLRLLGSGGMGVVYQAEHRVMERTVALKVIHPQLLAHPVALERFRREVKAAARLTHPNIVTAYDAEQAGDLHFLVMEHVEGRSLAELVQRRGPLPPREACQCIRQAAIGLQHAFQQGMVHRDIKPQNLMLTRDGRVKILDFGLARFARELELPPVTMPLSPSAVETAASSLLGTPDYMAPEQKRNPREVDIRADIYSLGSTLFFLLTGQSPSAGKGPLADRLPASTPAAVADCLSQMTADDPARRFATPAGAAAALREVAQALREPAAGETSLVAAERVEAPDHGRWSFFPKLAGRRRLRRRTAWAALAGVATIVLVAVYLGRTGESLHQRAPGGAPLMPADDQHPSSGGSSAAHAPSVTVPVSQRRPLLAIVPEEYNPDEFSALRTAIEGRFTITVASTGPGPCRPVAWKPDGPSLSVDLDFSQRPIDSTAYAAIVFVGGAIHRYKQPDAPLGAEVWKLIGQCVRQEKPMLAAIGEGIRVLAAVELLDDYPLALFNEQASQVLARHRNWREEPLAVQGNVVTARDPQAVPALVDRLWEQARAKGPK